MLANGDLNFSRLCKLLLAHCKCLIDRLCQDTLPTVQLPDLLLLDENLDDCEKLTDLLLLVDAVLNLLLVLAESLNFDLFVALLFQEGRHLPDLLLELLLLREEALILLFERQAA